MSKWEKVKLGDVCEICSSKRIFASEYIETGIPFYRGKEIIEKSKGNSISTELFISKIKYNSICEKFGAPKEDDLLLTAVGTLGIPYLVKKEKFYFKDGNILWLKNYNKVNPQFLYFWFCSYLGQNQINIHSIGSTQRALTIDALKKFNISLPPLEEQKRIAAILSSLDDKIEVNNQINKNLEEQAQAIFKSWFVDKNQDDYAVLSDYIVLNPKIILKKGTIASAIDMKDLSTINMSINAMAEKKAYNGGAKFQNNHTLLARITPCLENGKTAFVDFLDEGEIGFGSTEFIVMQAKKHVSPYYVYCLARDDDFRNYAIKSMVGSSGRQRVQVDVLENYPISKVSDNMFFKFSQYVEPMFSEIRKNTLENQCLAKIRETLLPKLINGEIHV